MVLTALLANVWVNKFQEHASVSWYPPDSLPPSLPPAALPWVSLELSPPMSLWDSFKHPSPLSWTSYRNWPTAVPDLKLMPVVWDISRTRIMGLPCCWAYSCRPVTCSCCWFMLKPQHTVVFLESVRGGNRRRQCFCQLTHSPPLEVWLKSLFSIKYLNPEEEGGREGWEHCWKTVLVHTRMKPPDILFSISS